MKYYEKDKYAQSFPKKSKPLHLYPRIFDSYRTKVPYLILVTTGNYCYK